ncbi:mitochondrial transcription rescue factor 1 [Perognathus longimembris pacificus]|uniref:mitochondrial transcription rescue factor 1 n=1 Tax=Perognathus longimembris pacificus TaxID=214514 RepID=UPI002018B7D2|nr:mitochondrial transcription rescue factor 1 [Perognathus longimembris pacificus]XP_048209701.1 mitochondrial transcription rescue factor 1 [Perognathus longimembris pacificus]XP_048209702.1 mitochondrial transcription rescue factor 1 [Perognathus longimembris pacificus]
MAVTGVRLLTGAFRKSDTWMRLWGVLQGTPSHHCVAWNRHLHLSSTKLNVPHHKKTLSHHSFSLRLPGLLVSPEYIPFSIRLKSKVSSKNSAKKTLQKVDEDSDDESVRSESEPEEEPEEDPSVPKDYKDLDRVVQSFRYDVILKTGLDVGRNKVEDAFYKGELRLNGEKLWKKSRTVKVGDTLDLVIGEDKEAETEVVMRVLLQKVLEEKTQSEKHRVVLRRWKKLQLPKKAGAK